MAKAASDKKALDIVTIDMRKLPGICDFFLVASGTSSTHVRAISDHIIRQFREKDQRLYHVEGEREALWILLDYGDVVAHIFYDETRHFYDLERLWREAPQSRYKEAVKKRKEIGKAKAKRKKRVR